MPYIKLICISVKNNILYMVQCLKCLKYHRTSIIIYDLFHSENGFHVWILISFKDLIKISFQSSFPSLYKYKCMYNACEHNQYQVGQRNFQRKSDCCRIPADFRSSGDVLLYDKRPKIWQNCIAKTTPFLLYDKSPAIRQIFIANTAPFHLYGRSPAIRQISVAARVNIQ